VKTRAKNRSRKSKQTNGQSPKETPVGAMVYSGPISSPSFHQAINLKTVPLLLDTQLTSTGGSVINNVYSSSPSTCADWSGASSIWKEFRTLGFRIDYVPNLKYATTNQGTIYSVVDYDSNTALSSYANATAQASCGRHVSYEKFSRTIKMNCVNDAQWCPTNAPVSLMWIKLYGDTVFGATQTYGHVLVTYMV
jgi:hypothetical protein